MKNAILIFLFGSTTLSGFAQNIFNTPMAQRKGQIFFYWGYNRAAFTKSDIRFLGANYDFTLSKTIAHDRQTPFEAKLYFGLETLTIPQYNIRFGYFLKDNLSVSFGTDHMKYVVDEGQTVKISGRISNSGRAEYDKTYNNSDIVIKPGFLEFEHTDGLNYFNADVRRYQDIVHKKNLNISLSKGFGIGGLLPRTNTTLLNNQRYDEFHLAGFGTNILASLKVDFYKYFFFQTELKGGYINMPDIRTTLSPTDKAKQHFFFTQVNMLFGFNVNVKKKKS